MITFVLEIFFILVLFFYNCNLIIIKGNVYVFVHIGGHIGKMFFEYMKSVYGNDFLVLRLKNTILVHFLFILKSS